MATLTGAVRLISWIGDTVVATIAAPPLADSSVYMAFRSSDHEPLLHCKTIVVNLLVNAFISGYPVEVRYNPNREIEQATIGPFDISPVGLAIHGDFYSIGAADIPTDVEIVFDSDAMTVAVDPDVVRPHCVFLEALPSEIPLGRNAVYLRAPNWTSASIPIDVSAGPPQTVRTLYSGWPKHRPYTMAFAANPLIETVAGDLVIDPVMADRAGYQRAAIACVRSLLTMEEDLLRQNDWDRQMRFISIYDATLSADEDNSLAREKEDSTIMVPQSHHAEAFLARYDAKADIVFVVFRSTTHDRESAIPTWDYVTSPPSRTAFTYDGAEHVHGYYPRTPGAATILSTIGRRVMTPIHEFCHAASDYNNGRVRDLYDDQLSLSFAVNKKWRAQSTDPIPAVFATYNGVDFPSDPTRDSLGYPTDWISYHPELISPDYPNLMDNYRGVRNSSLLCRLDRLTYAWFTDRLRAKLNRGT
jgi:hypothetical protein